MERSDWLLALSPVTGARRCELVATAGADAAPGSGPGSGPGLCRAERKRLDRTEPMPQEPRWRDNERTAYLRKYQEEKKKRHGEVLTEETKHQDKEEELLLSAGLVSSAGPGSGSGLSLVLVLLGAALLKPDAPPPMGHMMQRV